MTDLHQVQIHTLRLFQQSISSLERLTVARLPPPRNILTLATEGGMDSINGDLVKHAMDVICENKRFIGFFLASGLISIRPQLFTGVFLGVLGFGTLGPVGGSIAAAVQSMITPVATGGLFAILQSAAMDGYGAAKVHAIMALGGVVGMGLAVIDRFHGN